jgi:hypothetical protein
VVAGGSALALLTLDEFDQQKRAHLRPVKPFARFMDVVVGDTQGLAAINRLGLALRNKPTASGCCHDGSFACKYQREFCRASGKTRPIAAI